MDFEKHRWSTSSQVRNAHLRASVLNLTGTGVGTEENSPEAFGPSGYTDGTSSSSAIHVAFDPFDARFSFGVGAAS